MHILGVVLGHFSSRITYDSNKLILVNNKQVNTVLNNAAEYCFSFHF